MGLFDNVAGAFKGVFGEAEANAMPALISAALALTPPTWTTSTMKLSSLVSGDVKKTASQTLSFSFTCLTLSDHPFGNERNNVPLVPSM